MSHTINCEQCGHEIDIEQTLGKKISTEANYENAKRSAELDKREKIIGNNKEKFDEKVQEKVDFIVAKDRKVLTENYNKAMESQEDVIRLEVDKRSKSAIEKQEKEMNEDVKLELKKAKDTSIKNKELETDVLRMQAQIDSIQSEHKADTGLKVVEAINEANKKSDEEKELIQRGHDEKIKQMQKSLEDANRQANQGSMQIQGEAQEKSIEDFLKYNFPMDVIEPIKQGALGADCLQYVKTNNNQRCGTIYYESKRTKEFQPAWIEKFKADMRSKNVDAGVLATQAMPKGMKRAGLVKGVWVCSLEEFKTISHILRNQLVEIHKVRNISENRKDIASLLYKYLTSSEFKMDMEAIVEGFTEMKSDIDSEKRAMNRMWSKREKHLEKVILSTVNMYGSLQGISDNSIKTINGLELPGADYDQIEECESA